MAATHRDLMVEQDGRVLLITLHRPSTRNALSTNLLRELSEAILTAERDRTVHCLVVTGGDQVFAAGSDIREVADQRNDPALRRERQQYWSTLQQCALPVLAAVNGYCLGGGNELAMMCDMIVAGESALFGQPEIKLGLIPGAGALQRLTAALGKSRAMHLMLLGDPFTARQALEWGLVAEVTSDDRTLPRTMELARSISEKSRVAVWSAKEAIREAAEGHLDFDLNAARFEAVLESEDCREGVAAFLEKRNPVFKGT